MPSLCEQRKILLQKHRSWILKWLLLVDLFHAKFKQSNNFNCSKQGNFIQGVFFNWYPPKIHKYGKKLKYQNWYPPKIHKYGKKLKYQNWYPPQIHKVSVDPAPDHAESRLPAQLLSLKPNMVVTSWHLEILGGTSTKVGNILLTKNT